MAWVWAFLVGFVGLMVAAFWVGQARAVKHFGRESAQRNLRINLKYLVLIMPVAILAMGTSGFGVILVVTGLLAFQVYWVLSWRSRKKTIGRLLVNLGYMPDSLFYCWVGASMACVALLSVAGTWLLAANGLLDTQTPKTWGNLLVQEIGLWSLAIGYLIYGWSSLEIHDRGVCFLLGVVPWEKVSSYYWEPSKPTVLTLYFTAQFPFLSGVVSFPIPTHQWETVNHLLQEYLPDKNRSDSREQPGLA